MSESEADYIGRRNQALHSAFHGGRARASREVDAIRRAPSPRDTVVSALTQLFTWGARIFPDALGRLPAFADPAGLAEKVADLIL
jgi:hypothetical protein